MFALRRLVVPRQRSSALVLPRRGASTLGHTPSQAQWQRNGMVTVKSSTTSSSSSSSFSSFPPFMSSTIRSSLLVSNRRCICTSPSLLDRQKPLDDDNNHSNETDLNNNNPDFESADRNLHAYLNDRKSNKEKMKAFAKVYGKVGVVTHISLALCSLGAFYTAITFGLDVPGILMQLGVPEKYVATTGGAQNFALAYMCHKALGPMRIPVTFAVTPFVVRFLRKRNSPWVANTTMAAAINPETADELVRRLKGFSWIENAAVAGMAAPSMEQLKLLPQLNIGLVVNLREDPLPFSMEEVYGSDYAEQLATGQAPVIYHEPLTSVPSVEQIAKVVKVMQLASGDKKAVAVHCEFGMGRTGTVIACYLVAERGLSADDAIALVRKQRPGSIVKDEQVWLVRDYEISLKEEKARLS